VARLLLEPQERFTAEFGMGSEWFHTAIDTRKAIELTYILSYFFWKKGMKKTQKAA
jgi:hypothetical protein